MKKLFVFALIFLFVSSTLSAQDSSKNSISMTLFDSKTEYEGPTGEIEYMSSPTSKLRIGSRLVANALNPGITLGIGPSIPLFRNKWQIIPQVGFSHYRTLSLMICIITEGKLGRLKTSSFTEFAGSTISHRLIATFDVSKKLSIGFLAQAVSVQEDRAYTHSNQIGPIITFKLHKNFSLSVGNLWGNDWQESASKILPQEYISLHPTNGFGKVTYFFKNKK